MECSPFDLDLGDFPRSPQPPRTEGVHLTDVIKDIMEKSNMSRSIGGNSWGNQQLWMAGEVGFLWEEMLSNTLKGRLPNRIGELVVDGIAMSPDGLMVEEWALWEFKAVWSSSKRQPVEIWKWMAQCMGYCHGLGVTEVKMAILYLMGDWKGTGPEFRGYHIKFTEMEIRENWEMISGHARRMGWIK